MRAYDSYITAANHREKMMRLEKVIRESMEGYKYHISEPNYSHLKITMMYEPTARFLDIEVISVMSKDQITTEYRCTDGGNTFVVANIVQLAELVTVFGKCAYEYMVYLFDHNRLMGSM